MNGHQYRGAIVSPLCPACGERFEHFLRFFVHRDWPLLSWLIAKLIGRQYQPGAFCVICRACKQIVGYE